MRKLILLASGLMISAAVHAADNGIYVGASLGQARIEQKEDFVVGLDSTSVEFDADDLGFKVLAGVRPLDWLGVEGSYVNFGELEDTVSVPSQGVSQEVTGQIEGYGLAGYLVGFLPIGPVDIFGKAGVVSWDVKSKLEGDVDWFRDDGEDLTYGVGVQFRLLSLGVRAEYEVYDIDGVDDANFLSVGVSYTFL